MPHTASRRSSLSAVRSSRGRRRLARSSTRRVLWYHALTESSMSSTTGQPRQAAQQQQQCEYIHTCVYKRGRFPQTRDLWRKSASMGYSRYFHGRGLCTVWLTNQAALRSIRAVSYAMDILLATPIKVNFHEPWNKLKRTRHNPPVCGGSGNERPESIQSVWKWTRGYDTRVLWHIIEPYSYDIDYSEYTRIVPAPYALDILMMAKNNTSYIYCIHVRGINNNLPTTRYSEAVKNSRFLEGIGSPEVPADRLHEVDVTFGRLRQVAHEADEKARQ